MYCLVHSVSLTTVSNAENKHDDCVFIVNLFEEQPTQNGLRLHIVNGAPHCYCMSQPVWIQTFFLLSEFEPAGQLQPHAAR